MMEAKKTAQQAIREFSIPFLAAILWTLYEYFSAPSPWTVSASVKAFVAAFFFVSWMLSQWFRIRKQQKLEGNLSSIEASVNKTLSEVESRTKDLACYITGGQSICYLDWVEKPNANGQISKVAVRHQGSHPLYDIGVRVTDCDSDRRKFGAKPKYRDIYNAQRELPTLRSLAPKMVAMVDFELNLGSSNQRRFKVHFYARNGSFVQDWKFEKVDNVWLRATKVMRDTHIIYEDIPERFPVNENGEVDW